MCVSSCSIIRYSAEYTCRRVYSGIIRSKSNDVGWLWGFPSLQFSFQWRENRAFMHTQLTEIKWLLVILDL